MDRKMKPWIGITDFMNRQQTLAMARWWHTRKPQIPHRLMVGTMMSRKTLLGIPSKWAEVFPKTEEVPDIFVSDPILLNTLHYADFEGVDVANCIYGAILAGGIDIDAIQLDMIWPEPADIANGLHMSRKHLKVILQIGRDALERVEGDPIELAKVIEYEGYDEVLDGVLLDQSMGHGKLMDPLILREYILAIKKVAPNLAIGIAGGLGPETVGTIEPLAREFPDLSIDAQGRLRPGGDKLTACSTIPIDWGMAKNYANEACRIFELYQPR